MWKSGRALNGRQKYFGRLIIERGFYVARKLSGYQHAQAYRLLGDPRIKEYQLSLISDALGEIQLTLSGLLAKKLALADDIDTPAVIRNKIFDDLIDMARESGDKQEEVLRLTGAKKMLRPSKEIQEAEIIDEGNGNGKAKAESSEKGSINIQTETVGVFGETDNGSATGDISKES